ncbi:MAG: outer membrane beta-barrel protein, partial [Limisphaerales bacterium]
NVSDSFAIAQEPGVLDPGLTATSLRSQGNNLRNNFQIKHSWDDIIERWSGEAGYANTLYDYEQTGVGSRSALLDRVEHLLTLMGRYRIFDETETEALFGYSLGLTDNTSKDALDAAGNLPSTRDNHSHYFFTGMGHKFNPELKANGRIGLQYTEYPNASKAAPVFQSSTTSPYVDISGTWDYLPNSSLQLGIRHARVATDISASIDAEATTVYSSLNHEFVPGVKGSLLTQYQQTQFQQTVGQRDAADGMFTVGLNMEWQFHQFVSLEGGYNYDRLDSDIGGRSYYRNRIYLGFKGTW